MIGPSRARAPIRVDRDRFLALAVALSAHGCARATADPPIAAPLEIPASTVAVPPATITPLATPPPAPASATPPANAAGAVDPPYAPSTCEKDNDTGSVDCTRVRRTKLNGPACEGVSASKRGRAPRAPSPSSRPSARRR